MIFKLETINSCPKTIFPFFGVFVVIDKEQFFHYINLFFQTSGTLNPSSSSSSRYLKSCGPCFFAHSTNRCTPASRVVLVSYPSNVFAFSFVEYASLTSNGRAATCIGKRGESRDLSTTFANGLRLNSSVAQM